MELTVENFKLALGVISGRFAVGTLSLEQMTSIGWDANALPPTLNQLKDTAENYVTQALIDLSTRLYVLENQ